VRSTRPSETPLFSPTFSAAINPLSFPFGAAACFEDSSEPSSLWPPVSAACNYPVIYIVGQAAAAAAVDEMSGKFMPLAAHQEVYIYRRHILRT